MSNQKFKAYPPAIFPLLSGYQLGLLNEILRVSYPKNQGLKVLTRKVKGLKKLEKLLVRSQTGA